MRVMTATHVPEGRVTSVAAPDRALSPKQSGEGGIVGKPDRIRLRGVYPARLLTDTSRLTQKGDSPSCLPLPPKKAPFRKGSHRKQTCPVQPANPYSRAGLGPRRQVFMCEQEATSIQTSKEVSVPGNPHNGYLFRVLGNPNANGGLTEASNSRNKSERS